MWLRCCLFFDFLFFFCLLVVTFRKVQAIRRVSSSTRPTIMASRKRKYPGAGKSFPIFKSIINLAVKYQYDILTKLLNVRYLLH